MGEARQIRDPIHGFVSLNKKECKIIDTSIFQRLRRIRQLAFAHLVYPGALHTRFDHSLGVCHVARRLGKALRFREEEEELVCRAGLLHDLGHGPFSHVAETILEMYADQEKLARFNNKMQIHELITLDILETDPEITKILATDDREQITKLLSDGYGDPILRDIISGPLDADKQDYLLRDSHFCGVKYGLYDMDQLLNQLRRGESKTGSELRISRDGVHALEQFVLAKYFITEQVYRHKVRLITDQMLIRAIRLGIEEDQIEELRTLFSYDGSPKFVRNYTKFDDASFLEFFLRDKLQGKYLHNLLKRLRQRKLLKQVFRKRAGEFPENCRRALGYISDPDNKRLRDKTERIICEEMNRILDKKHRGVGEIDPRFTVMHSYTVKSVRTQSQSDEKKILVDDPRRPRYFEEESSLFRSIDEKLNESFVEVYAPVEYETPQERKDIINKLENPLIQAISNALLEGEDNADP